MSQIRVRAQVAAIAAVLALVASMGVGVLVAQAQPADGPLPTVVFLARADNPVDALGAGSVAGQLGAPVLLTGSNALDPAAAAALQTAGPDLVVLAGGTAALSQQVHDDVVALGLEVRRVSGAGRTQTAAEIAAFARELGIGRPVVTGRSVGAGTIPGLDAELLQGLAPGDLAHTPGPVVVRQSTVQLGPNSAQVPTTIWSYATGTVVSGDGYLELPLSGPAELDGVAYGLESVTYCISEVLGSAQVSYVDIWASDHVSEELVKDSTARTAEGCYTVDVGHADGIAYTLLWRLEGGSTLRINGVQTTWLPVDQLSEMATTSAAASAVGGALSPGGAPTD